MFLLSGSQFVSLEIGTFSVVVDPGCFDINFDGACSMSVFHIYKFAINPAVPVVHQRNRRPRTVAAILCQPMSGKTKA